MNRILRGDVRSFSRHYRGEKFHAMVCDPPYELSFMSKKWDGTGVAFDPETWEALAEHLHPGGFGMAFASSRGWHRLAVAIEDAGLRIHPSIFGFCFGSGFPKATRIDTQIDKAAGAERKVIEIIERGSVEEAKERGASYLADPANRNNKSCFGYGTESVTAPSTDMAKAWEGHRYGLQAMKPALEPIIVFQKPYSGKPVESIVETGAGALNIDGGRIGTEERVNGGMSSLGVMHDDEWQPGEVTSKVSGRWPANFYLDEEGARRLGENDESRFFFNVNRQIDEADPVLYKAKASRKERDAGLEGMARTVRHASYGEFKGTPEHATNMNGQQRNPHPTVKPIDLCRWLATLLLPPAEYAPRRILIPFGGVMSEAIGAMFAGFEEIIAIEMEKEYCEIGQARIDWWASKMQETGASDPRAILGTCGKKGRTKPNCEESWRNGNLFGIDGEE